MDPCIAAILCLLRKVHQLRSMLSKNLISSFRACHDLREPATESFLLFHFLAKCRLKTLRCVVGDSRVDHRMLKLNVRPNRRFNRFYNRLNNCKRFVKMPQPYPIRNRIQTVLNRLRTQHFPPLNINPCTCSRHL